MSFLIQLTLLLLMFAIGRYTAGHHPTFKAFLALVLFIGVAAAASFEASLVEASEQIRFQAVRSPSLDLTAIKAKPTPPAATPSPPLVIAPLPRVAQPAPAVQAPQCHFYWNPASRSWIRFCQ